MDQENFFFLVSMLCNAGYGWMAWHFCKTYLRPKGAGKVFPVLVFFSYTAGDMVCKNISYLAGMACFHMVFLGLVLFFFHGAAGQKLLTAVLLDLALKLAREFAGSAFFVVWLFFLREEGAAASSGNLETCAALALQAAAAATAVFLLLRPLVPVLEGKLRKWYLVAAIPLMAMAALLDVLGWGATKGILFRGQDQWNLYYNQLLSHGANLVVTLACMCAGCFYIFGMDRIYREQKRSQQYQSQVAAYRMLEGQYRQMERLRHDMKNHVIGLRGLLREKEWEKMEDYLSKMSEAGALCESGETTGNQVADALLYQKKKEAEGNRIRWESNLHIPRACGIDDFDFCVLIGNILDNAIESCAKLSSEAEKFIAIQSGVKKSFFLLEAKNSTSLTDIAAIKRTGKENPESHGIGLSNILETAKKYNGTVQTELEGQVFTISVLLPFPHMASGEPFVTKP